MEFRCSVCDYTSFSKFSAERHLTKQKKCGDNASIIEVPVDIKCEHCDKSYKTKEVLNKHLKICKTKKNNIELELELVKKELAELKQGQSSINIKGNNNNVNITNNYIIQLTSYNQPKLPLDMKEVCEDAWLRQKDVRYYIENIHFCNELPENRNICITNLRTKMAKVFNGTNWETRDQDALLDEIISNTNIMLEKWVRTNKNRPKYEQSFLRYIEEKGKKKFDEETKNDLKLLLYDGHKNNLVNIKSNTQTPYDPIENADNVD